MRLSMVFVGVLGSASTAVAGAPVLDAPVADAPAVARHDQIQADLGLGVIQLAYEHRLGGHVSASLSAGIFGSYFLPWFDLGDAVVGLGGGVRVTWFAQPSGRGFYVAPFVRGHHVTGDHAAIHGSGYGFDAGAFAGWAFGLGDTLDVRAGIGAQIIDHYLDTPTGRSSTLTPFVALDLVVGYRL